MTEKNPDREIIKERRRLGAFLVSLSKDEIEGIKKVLLSSLIEYERRNEEEQRGQNE